MAECYCCHSSYIAREAINVRNLYAHTWHEWKRTLLDGPWKYDWHHDWYHARYSIVMPSCAFATSLSRSLYSHRREDRRAQGADKTCILFDLPAHINIAHDTHAILDTTARGGGKKHHAPSASRGASCARPDMTCVCVRRVPGLHLGAHACKHLHRILVKNAMLIVLRFA